MSFGGCYAIHHAGQESVDRGSTIHTASLLIRVVVARVKRVSGHRKYPSTIAWPNLGGSRMHTVSVPRRCDATHVLEKPTAHRGTYLQILCQRQPLLEQPSSAIKIRNGKRAIAVKRPLNLQRYFFSAHSRSVLCRRISAISVAQRSHHLEHPKSAKRSGRCCILEARQSADLGP